ncbi:MerC domain-containing protein [Ekhidna sp.]|uniref:MerC domain-containing protein n=1 Tax=Ekhidna sp. TaxID=2608089 RepID=UPI003C7B307B
MKLKITPDNLGICVSLLCVFHCIAIPFLVIFGLDLFLGIVDQEWIELTIIGAALLIGIFSFLSGFLRHKQHFIPILFVAGFLLIINGESVTHLWVSAGLSIAGALVIIYAHVQNLKWRHHGYAH